MLILRPFSITWFRQALPIGCALSLHGGQPFSVIANSDELGNGDSADRAMVTGVSPFSGILHTITGASTTAGGTATWFNPAAFSEPNKGRSAISAATSTTTRAFRMWASLL
jgi:hypothetical protein